MRSMTVTERTGESSVDSMYSSMKSPFTTSTMQANDSEFKLKHNAALSLTGDGNTVVYHVFWIKFNTYRTKLTSPE